MKYLAFYKANNHRMGSSKRSLATRSSVRVVAAIMCLWVATTLPAFATIGCTDQNGASDPSLPAIGVLDSTVEVTPSTQAGAVLWQREFDVQMWCGKTEAISGGPSDLGYQDILMFLPPPTKAQLPAKGLQFFVEFNGQPVTATGTKIGSTKAFLVSNSTLTGDKIQGRMKVVLKKISTGTTPTSGSFFSDWDPVAYAPQVNTTSKDYVFYVNGLKKINFKPYTCRIDTPDKTVFLPSSPLNKGSGLGSGVGSFSASIPFQIDLACDNSSGTTRSFNLTMKMDDAGAAKSSAPGVLMPRTNNGAAADVGIQVLQTSGIPVQFGQFAAVGSVTNVPNTKTGVLNAPYLARYYQLGANPTPGTVTAVASLTVNYN